MSALVTDRSPVLPPVPTPTGAARVQGLGVPSVRAVADARPPSSTWATPAPAPLLQPRLVFDPVTLVEEQPRPRGHRVLVARQPWAAVPSPVLPDPRPWSASLALALAEVLQGHRPVGQLSRWVDEQVLSALTLTAREQRRQAGTSARPAVLRSVHLQFPHPEAVEVAAHVHVAGRPQALAFRLQGWCDRWLCTALETGLSAPRGARGTS